MISKVLTIITITILILIPYLPISESILAPSTSVDYSNITFFLLICSCIILFSIGLIFVQKPNVSAAGLILFTTGMAVIFPLHLGPPRENADLLQFALLEKSRYGILTFAVILVMAGTWKSLSKKEIIAVVLIGITATLNLWDNISSFLFSSQLQQWIDSGQKADEFFQEMDYHLVWRGIARICLYVLSIFMSFQIMKNVKIKKWQFYTVSLFAIIGIAFCTLTITFDPNFYFPFMVPAIAIAPFYWIGLMLLLNRTNS